MTQAKTIKADGAELYYEVRGSGPVLLLICGGIYDATGYAALAGELSDRYTVVTYDRRGNSRSPLDGPAEPQRIEVHADDASLVLRTVTDEPAYVFGNSSGATIALALASRNPEQVRAAVAHEPPVLELLPDREHWRTVLRDVETAYAKEGAGAAMYVFGSAMGMGSNEETPEAEPASAPDPEAQAAAARMGANMDFFIGYEVPPFGEYVPDVPTLQSSSSRITIGVGETSQGQPAHDAGLALADRLGTPPAVFPGDHGGFGSHPTPFAAKLHDILNPKIS